MTITKLKILAATALSCVVVFGGIQTYGRQAARKDADPNKEVAKPAVNPAANVSLGLPGRRDSVFGGGRDHPLYQRHGDLFFVTSPVGDEFAIYDALNKRASVVTLPGTKAAPLKVVPIYDGGLVDLMLDGPSIRRIYVFSVNDWKWYPQDLKEVVSGLVDPSSSRFVAAYGHGRFVYAFSDVTKRWSTLELPDGVPAQPQVNVDSVMLEHREHVYEFRAQTGEWKHTDLRAVVDAAIRAAKERAKDGATPGR